MPLHPSAKLADEASDVLATLLEDHPGLLSNTYTCRPDVEKVTTFAETDMKTDAVGVLIRLKDGSEIHLTATAYTPDQE